MAIVNQAYSAQRITLLHQVLLADAEEGRPREYDISVDDLKVVRRTTDPERFLLHEDFISPDTRSVVITLYEGSSKRNTRYFFTLKGIKSEEEEKSQTLAGVEAAVSEKLLEQKKDWEIKRLQEEVSGLQEEVEENETYIEELEAKLREEQAKKVSIKDNWGEVVSAALEGMVRRNTHLLSSLPMIGQGLAGVVEEDNKRLNSSGPSSESAVSFSKKGSEGSEQKSKSAGGATTAHELNQERMATLCSQFSEVEFSSLLQIVATLYYHRPFINDVIDYLTEETKNEEKND